MMISDKPRISKVFFFLLTLLHVYACNERTLGITGKTMGTNYTIKIRESGSIGMQMSQLQEKIQAELDRLEGIFSTYKEDSEISKFNSAYKDGKWYRISEDFYAVMKTALEIKRKSNDSFSPQIGSLVNLWGFGPEKRTERPNNAIVKAYQRCTWAIRFETKNNAAAEMHNLMGSYASEKSKQLCSAKSSFKPQLDLSGIAKGYAVDKISALLLQNNIQSFMAEIGGEVCVHTRNSHDAPWRIGIKHPAMPEKIHKVVSLKKGCMATSGNTHQYFMHNGKFFTHILQPFSGYPVERTMSSVTVISDSNTEADAWATALYVMGSNEGLRLANGYRISSLYLTEKNGTILDENSASWDYTK